MPAWLKGDLVLFRRWTGEQTNFLLWLGGKKQHSLCLVSKDVLALVQSAAWELFVCGSLKNTHSALSACSLTHVTSLILWPEFDILKLLYVAAGSTPHWLCPHTLRRTHSYCAFPFLCHFNNAPPPLDAACIDSVPRGGLVFYITSDISAGFPCGSSFYV